MGLERGHVRVKRPKSVLAIMLYIATGIGGWLGYDHYRHGGLPQPAIAKSADARQTPPEPPPTSVAAYLPAWPGATVSAERLMQLLRDVTRINVLYRERERDIDRIVRENTQ